ncbi:hypothetical protein AGR7C_Lc140166 [Agrobacterium deltaense Zutra 3/1]|uniref:Uncharacterized protein n=1 Tax=Agrobacterium deltaense Zutra 3/1 TaxID=1183427 RepID=A0A1S7RB27_9HYPH|nr:hypothetical protein AGR7C_Lc140166 [Agrobacterium deltaense Zutra 3/1]
MDGLSSQDCCYSVGIDVCQFTSLRALKPPQPDYYKTVKTSASQREAEVFYGSHSSPPLHSTLCYPKLLSSPGTPVDGSHPKAATSKFT